MNGPDRIFVGRHHPLFEFIQELYESNQLDSVSYFLLLFFSTFSFAWRGRVGGETEILESFKFC